MSLYHQETELLLFEGILPHIDRTFVDVGAEKGTFALWLLERGFSGALCEPLPQHAPTLQAIAATHPVGFLPFAIDAMDGERDFHIATDEQGRPLDYFHSLQSLQGDARVHHTKSVRVQCRSLDSLAKEGRIPAEPGLLKIDTEGHDLHVLRGLGAMRPAAVMTEFFTEGIYHGWTDAHPDRLVEQARQMGYDHFIAVRRNKTSGESVDHNPLAMPPGEWGNLLFLRSDLFALAEPALKTIVLRSQVQQQERWNQLLRTCEERLALVHAIQAEAEKRLSLIQELTKKTPS